MGIEGFQPWLRAKFGGDKPVGPKSRYFYDLDAFLASNKRKKVRRLFIDLNALIHNAVTEVYGTADENLKEDMYSNPDRWWISEDGVFETVLANIYKINMLVKPKELLYLGADGVVTKAKMQQQRERSFAALMTPEQPFDRTQIKPGTQFMNSLSAHIKSRLPQMYKQNPGLWPRFIEFSDASLHGEGEHKIMKRMIEKPGRADKEFRDSIDVVYSPDSDMALLTMLHAAVDDQVVVMREQPTWNHLTDDDYNRWEFYDATGIKSDLKDVYGISHVSDFILITIFAGNDFLPGLPCTMGDRMDVFTHLVQAYTEVFSATLRQPNLVRGEEIDWARVKMYLNYFTIFQQILLKDMYIEQYTNEDKYVTRDADTQEIVADRRWAVLEAGMATVERTFIDERGKNRKIEAKDFDPLIFMHEYHRFINGVWSDPSKVDLSDVDLFQTRDMAKAYLCGIRWIMTYYWSREEHVNVNWAYGFTYAPTVQDLIRTIDQSRAEDFEREARILGGRIVTPVEHLLAILPEEKLHFVPKVVRATFTTYMPELFPSDFVIDYSGVRFDEDKGREIHKAKILINTPSLDRIHRLFEQFAEDPAVIGAMGSRKMWSRTVQRLK